MKTNDIKKGTRIQLHNGWYGTMMCNGRGNKRLVEVEGFVTETGYMFVWDIKYIVDHNIVGRPEYVPITLTDTQVTAKQNVEMFI